VFLYGDLYTLKVYEILIYLYQVDNKSNIYFGTIVALIHAKFIKYQTNYLLRNR